MSHASECEAHCRGQYLIVHKHQGAGALGCKLVAAERPCSGLLDAGRAAAVHSQLPSTAEACMHQGTVSPTDQQHSNEWDCWGNRGSGEGQEGVRRGQEGNLYSFYCTCACECNGTGNNITVQLDDCNGVQESQHLSVARRSTCMHLNYQSLS